MVVNLLETYEIERTDFPNGIELVILCCQTSDDIYLTIKVQQEKHLQEKTTVSERQDN